MRFHILWEGEQPRVARWVAMEGPQTEAEAVDAAERAIEVWIRTLEADLHMARRRLVALRRLSSSGPSSTR